LREGGRRKSRWFMKSPRKRDFFSMRADKCVSLARRRKYGAIVERERIEGKRKMDGILGYMSQALFIGGLHEQVLCILYLYTL
jgi:hypothetical protein